MTTDLPRDPFALKRAIFQLTGSDRVRYLNGQITQDVTLASTSQAVYSAITTAKGKMEGDLYVREYQESLLIDAPLCLRESLLERIDKYLIADDVTITDLTSSHSFIHQFSETPSPPENSASWQCNRYGIPGWDYLITQEQAARYPDAESSQLESLRIEHKIPLWGAELDPSILPPEAKLEDRAISYSKGCYIGQEVISRIRSAGKTNLALTSFRLSAAVTPPCDFYVSEDPKPAGRITSCTELSGEHIALGYLKRKYSEQSEFHIDSVSLVKIP